MLLIAKCSYYFPKEQIDIFSVLKGVFIDSDSVIFQFPSPAVVIFVTLSLQKQWESIG